MADSMFDGLTVDLPAETRRILTLIAEAGVLGGTPEEVVAYMVARELDDMMRSGALKLGAAE